MSDPVTFVRAVLRTLTAASAALLLLGFGSSVRAQDKPDKIEATPDKPVTGLQSIGDDSIEPNQPIKSNFILSVSVVGEADPSGNYPVDQAGNVSIRYQGIQTPVSVKDLTPAQAADAIAKFLKTYIKNPQVTVSIVSIPRPIVFVSGAVKSPGPVVIGKETTLVDLLSHVVWTEIADLTCVRITHRSKNDKGEDKRTVTIVNFGNYLKVDPSAPPDERDNPILQDRDSILVPLKSLPGNGVVSVFGEVTKPQQGIPLRLSPPMTVREVINLVGGTTGAANRKSISIRRPTVDRPLVIDLDKAEQGDLVNNIELRPDDAVYVEKLENNAYINMNGGFVKAGKLIYDKRTTLTQAVMESGGLAPYTKESSGLIFRHPDNDPKHTQIIVFNWADIKKAKSPDLELQPGDTVWVTPSGPARDPINLFSVLQALTSTAYLYNSLNGRYFH